MREGVGEWRSIHFHPYNPHAIYNYFILNNYNRKGDSNAVIVT